MKEQTDAFAQNLVRSHQVLIQMLFIYCIRNVAHDSMFNTDCLVTSTRAVLDIAMQ